MGRITNALKALVSSPNYVMEGNTRVFNLLKNFSFGKGSIETSVKEGYNINTYVYSIVNAIANSATSIPLQPQKKNKQGAWEVLESGDFHKFATKPNENENIYNFVKKSLIYYLTTGNVAFHGVKGEVMPNFYEAHVLSPLLLEAKKQHTLYGAYASSWKYYAGGKEYPLTSEEIKLVKMFNADVNDIFGMSPLMAGYRTLQASNEIILADASLIKNRGALGMLSNKGERPLTTPEREATNEALREMIGGGENFGAIKTTSGNFDYLSFAMSPTDLKILESGVMKLRDLCSIYGVSSKMFNDITSSSFNNIKEDNKSFYLRGVLPPLEQIIEAYNDYFVTGWNKRDASEYRLAIDYSAIDALQEDMTKKTVGQKNQSEIIINVVSGIGTQWSEASAIEQLIMVLGITEEKAKLLIDRNGITRQNSETV